MTCPYCSALNSSHDHRCVKCARRLYLVAPRPDSGVRASTAATAPALTNDFDVATEPVLGSEPGQGTLFPNLREPLKIVRMQQSHASRRDVIQRAAPARPPRENRQQSLPLQSSVTPQPRPYDRHSHGNARVAMPAHRMMATAVDGALVM